MSRTKNEAFHKGVYGRRRLTEIPKIIDQYLKSKGLVGYWLDFNTVTKYAGSDTRGYKVFKITPELEHLKKTVEESWEVDFSISSDGTVRRESMILGYMPKTRRDAHFAFFSEQNKMSAARIRAIAEEKGLEADEVRVGSRTPGKRKVTIDDITGE